MTAPVFALSTSGTDPKVTTKELLEIGINAGFEQLYGELAAINTGLTPAGAWSAASGSFPSNAALQTYYIVSTAGTTGGQTFAVGDWLIPLVNLPSTSTYAGNWTRGDYSKIVPSGLPKKRFASPAALFLDTTLGSTVPISDGDEVEADGHRYMKVSSGEHKTTAGGVKLKVLAGEFGFNIKACGAVGDDTTNDAAAINLAYAAAEAVEGTVYWPAAEYFTGTTQITCAAKVATYAPGAIMRSSATGDAFVIEGVNDSETYGQFHVLPYINRTTLGWNAGTDTTSVGLRIKDRKYNTFVIQGIKRFYRGLALEAEAANHVCNTYQLGVIQNCQYSIDFSDVTAPWGINQNTFVGGACVIDSAYTTATPRIYLNMPDAENNGNTFVGVNLEKGANEKAIVCAARGNVWLNCRFEGCSSAAGYITLSGNSNRIIGGGPNSFDTVPFVTWITDTGFGNSYDIANVLANKYIAIDFNSASKPIRLGNGSAYPAVPIGGFGTDRMSLGDSSTTAVRYWGMMQQESPPITSGTTLPQRSALVLTYGSATTVVGISVVGGTDTSTIVAITATNGNATLQHTAGPAANAGRFVLTGGVNLLLTANSPVLFQMVGGNFYQVA